MKVKVSNITNKWLPVKKGVEEGYNMVVVTQALEETKVKDVSVKEGGTVKLNLNSEQKNKSTWLNALKEGNVLQVQPYLFGRKIIVSKYHDPIVIKESKDGKQAIDVI